MSDWAQILANSQIEQQRQSSPLTLLSLMQAKQNLQTGQLENQKRQMDIQAAQRQQQDAQTIQQALAQNPGATYGDILPKIQGKISPGTWTQLVEADQKMRKGLSEQTKADLENTTAQHAQYQQIYDGIMNMPDQQVQQNWPQIVQAIKSVPGNKINLDPAQPLNKQQLQQFGPMLSLNDAYLKSEQAKREAAATLEKTQAETTKYQADAQKAQMEANQGGSSDQARYTQTYLQSNNLPDTPQNRMKAFDDYNQKTKIQPAQIRVEGFGAIRQNPVFDNVTKQTVYMDSNTLNAANAKEPGRYSVPGYTPEAVGQKSTTEYFTKGKGGQQLTAFNTAIDHLNQMDQLADRLGNGDLQALNSLSQTISQATGNPVPAEFEAIRSALAGEVANTLKANGATDQEIHKVYDTFSRAQSPQQLHGVANTYRGLLGSKRHNLQQQYDAGMSGKPNFGGNQNGPQAGYVRIQASDGSLHDLPQQNLDKARQRDPGLKVIQ